MKGSTTELKVPIKDKYDFIQNMNSGSKQYRVITFKDSHANGDDEVLLSYKGSMQHDSGVIFCPYVSGFGFTGSKAKTSSIKDFFNKVFKKMKGLI